MNDEGLLPVHGGYRRLRTFQIAESVYDGTATFCERFIALRSRTYDQMVQAARSGRQNIAEGSVASATSKKTELKLTNVAKASLEELLLDYEDYLRQRGLRMWEKDSPEALAVRQRYQQERVDLSDPYSFKSATDEVAANTMVCLINQATYLLRRQIQRLERDFLEHGGVTERLYDARSCARTSQSGPALVGRDHAPTCPKCGNEMLMRIARKGTHAGQPFWGCTDFPRCRGTRPYEGD